MTIRTINIVKNKAMLDGFHRLLLAEHWEKVEHPNKNIEIFQGHDAEGEEASLVLPAEADLVDAASLIEDAVNILSVYLDKPREILLSRLLDNNVDILRVRSFRLTGRDDYLPLDVASNWIQCIRQLIASSAYTEYEPKRSFDKTGSVGTNFVHHCRFGHTFEGSFGISIEAPIAVSSTISSATISPIIPFERKVFQRIAHGLQTLSLAVVSDSIEPLIQSFQTGLNANMCRSLSDAYEALDGRRIEYRFTWNTSVPLALDLEGTNSFIFDGRAYEFSKATALELEQQSEQEEETIEGKIYQLKSKFPPEEIGLDPLPNERLIIIDWHRGDRPNASIRVPLTLADYQEACNAHRDGKRVRVTGIPLKQGKFWTLINPYGFTILEAD